MHFSDVIAFFKPHKTVPIIPWRADHRWQLSLSRVAILFFGLAIFGLGDSLLVQGDVGNAPWTVFSQGLTYKTGLSIGWATAIISIFVLLIWIPLNEKPGFGTLSNIVLIAAFIEIGTHIFPKQTSTLAGVVFALVGIAMVGLGSALYITCGLGPGPRDGAMTGIHFKTGIRVGRVRMGIELVVLTIGWLMGGRVGIGTALFALLIGQSVAIFLGIVARLTRK
ncbi:COG2364 Predicted membrane protein [Candidatus Planktophila dulcis]|uniref:membrane protein YczE n=1 Tax=Candidatus Planktophila dulcis TaxID=1884914 RepID=UPI003BEED158